ncbi:hypothetical protein ASC97_05670 [Rhizobium sp. Root1203]|uniref:hypothetical protein n=1 Tax=Rhizobium sp. Root1203 TaxID=1736427 RepID=UPI0007106507|nr:hypothetical protein [Rhizobium sp. Root1203]KQV27852.1 hypothetical protein ASC97_05670 [Rhizobium sp. Root1203]
MSDEASDLERSMQERLSFLHNSIEITREELDEMLDEISDKIGIVPQQIAIDKAIFNHVTRMDGYMALADVERATRLLGRLASAYEPKAEPPSLFWVELLTPASAGPDFVLNLEEVYFDRWLPKYGARRARLIVISQGIQFVGRQWIGPLVKLFDRLKSFALG